MNYDNLSLILIGTFVLVSSGCMGLLESENSTDSKELLEEGNILTYQSNGENFEIVFYNETEDYIGMAALTQRSTERFRINKQNGTSQEGLGSELFLSSLLLEASHEEKIERLMNEGEDVNITSNSQSSILSRSDQIDFKGVQAYNVSFDAGRTFWFLVHAESPYILLKSPEGEYVSMNHTDSPESYISEQSSSSDVDKNLGDGAQRDINKVGDTSLSLSPVYAKGDGSKEQMRLTVTNTGERPIDVSEYTIYYGPPNYDPVSYSTLDSVANEWTVDSNNGKCFNQKMVSNSSMSNTILSVGERASCSTGIRFPDASETVDIRVEANKFDYSHSYGCRVESSGAKSC